MATFAERAIDFLERHDCLALGETPWTTCTDEDEALQVDWPVLFPRHRGRQLGDAEWGDDEQWANQLDGAFIEELGEVLSGRDSRPPDSGESGGWDVCAWYQPIHFFGPEWGIFIREECVRAAVLRIGRSLAATEPVHNARESRRLAPKLWRAAVYMYFLHEHYHHKVECLGFRLHVATGRSSYLPYKSAVYDKCKGTDDQLEEALANASSYLRLGDPPYRALLTPPVVKATKEYLEGRFPLDPPGYRRAVSYLRAPSFSKGENLLQARVLEGTLCPVRPCDDWDLAPRMMQSFLDVRADVWIVVPRGCRPVTPVAALGAPTCSARELVRLCEKWGYIATSGGKGSHVKMRKPGANPIIVTGTSKPPTPGVIAAALKALGNFRLADLPRLLSGMISPAQVAHASGN